MELVEPTQDHEHKWLERLGLRESAPVADSWVPIARAFAVDDTETNSSSVAAQLVSRLGAAGVKARQRPYQLDTTQINDPFLLRGRISPTDSVIVAGNLDPITIGGGLVTRVAVAVHGRDRAKGAQIAVEFERELERQRHASQAQPQASVVSDQELTRMAMEAGPPPE
jgi:hypothetical protein